MARNFLCLCFFNSWIFVSSAIQPTDTALCRNRTKKYTEIQYAGNAGLFSVHGGISLFQNHLNFSLGYGYLPKAINGVEVHSVILKTKYQFNKGVFLKKANWYTGFSAICGFTSNTFICLPSYYPKKYYASNAMHVAPFIGCRYPFPFYKPIWAKTAHTFIELATLDTYFWYRLNNNHLQFWDICNLSVGLCFNF
jgi:hypothetical protein